MNHCNEFGTQERIELEERLEHGELLSLGDRLKNSPAVASREDYTTALP
jgi:hypothetical protein